MGGSKGKRPLGIPRGRWEDDNHQRHHKHQGLDPLIRSVTKVTTALSNVSSVFLLFSDFKGIRFCGNDYIRLELQIKGILDKTDEYRQRMIIIK